VEEQQRRLAEAALLLCIGNVGDACTAVLPLLDESSHVGQSDEAVEIGARQIPERPPIRRATAVSLTARHCCFRLGRSVRPTAAIA
jgi:hypothetical protein